MNDLSLIDENISPLFFKDDGDKGILIMQDHCIRHLPVIQEDKTFVGIVSEDILMDGHYQFGDEVGHFVMSSPELKCKPNTHWMEIVNFMEDHQLTIAPLVDENGIYNGLVTFESILRFLSKANFITEEGSILIVETNRFSFSILELGKIIETNDSKLLYLDTDLKGEENMWITLKIKTMNLSSIIETLERYNFVIINSYQETVSIDNLKDRYDALMKYLNT